MKRRWMRELADFQRFCTSERRLAPMTCAAYERDVSACLDYLQGQGIRDLGAVKVKHLRAFLAEEQKRRPAVSSQARTTAALKCFFRFLVEEERIVRNPALPLRTPKKRESLPDTLTMSELERLLAQPGRDDVWERHFPGKPERDRLLLALMAYAGLRRSELLGLEWDDVDLSRRLLRVRKAKGGRERTIPIHSALAPLFAEYYATRVPLTAQAVFLGVQGKPLNYTQLGQVFRHYVSAARVNERKLVTPHTLRHVFASELLRAGANLRQIQELLGHKHLDSTQRYTRVNAHELRGAIKRLRWVG
ncbi:MAG TPA: tyrosine-type recombinase/integrase [Gaiellaceae bacterium]